MARQRRGKARFRNGRWYARVMLEGKNRPTFALPFTERCEEREANARAAVLADLAQKLRRAKQLEVAPTVLTEAAGARDAKALGDVERLVDGLCAGAVLTPGKPANAMTFEDVANEWTSGRLATRYPDHVRTKRSVRDDRQRLKDYILPVVRDVLVARFTIDDAERVMRALPGELATNTRRSAAVLVHRVLGLAVFPLRLRESNPLPRGWLPKPGRRKAKSYLYPDEDAALLGCGVVPFRRRFAYGFLAREGNRKSEGLAMILDLERGAAALDVNKTDEPRSWALDAGVAGALRAARDLLGAGEIDATMREMATLRGDQLRDDLRAAGVTRPELFEASATRDPINVHALRATFVTLSLAAGRSEAWVADRTGHKSSHMINQYKRAARSVAELGLGALAPLVSALPELIAATAQRTRWRRNGAAERRDRRPRLPNANGFGYLHSRKRLAGWCRPRSSKSMWGS